VNSYWNEGVLLPLVMACSIYQAAIVDNPEQNTSLHFIVMANKNTKKILILFELCIGNPSVSAGQISRCASICCWIHRGSMVIISIVVTSSVQCNNCYKQLLHTVVCSVPCNIVCTMFNEVVSL